MAIDISERKPADQRTQIKSRARVRDLAEVYTHSREVDAMLDLVPDMFPNEERPLDTDRTFLEPACGTGNFLEEILLRKLAFVTTRRLGRGERFEHRMLRCLGSIYGIDISEDNVLEARERLRVIVDFHLEGELLTNEPSDGFRSAVETILATNIIHADTLAKASRIELVEYRAGPGCTFLREWSFLEETTSDEEPFSIVHQRRDASLVHYTELSSLPRSASLAGLVGRGI